MSVPVFKLAASGASSHLPFAATYPDIRDNRPSGFRFVPGFRCYSTGNREQITNPSTQTGAKRIIVTYSPARPGQAMVDPELGRVGVVGVLRLGEALGDQGFRGIGSPVDQEGEVLALGGGEVA